MDKHLLTKAIIMSFLGFLGAMYSAFNNEPLFMLFCIAMAGGGLFIIRYCIVENRKELQV